jgi:transposase
VISDAQRPLSEAHRKRGLAGQRAQRAAERRVRLRVLAFCRWAVRRGLNSEVVADCLGIGRRTLFRWKTRWRKQRLRVRGRGRPARRADLKTRRQLLALIELLGPGVGVPSLQASFPQIARREVRDILRRYRKAWKRKRRLLSLVLHWKRPGSVWAIDFAEPPLPVDGCYKYLFAVRDLASGMQLLWLPVRDESARTAIAALAMLFRQHGPPLVLKSDNGSAFIAKETQRLLDEWRVWHLRSPPEWPEYNGACEAGIGSMKTRTHHESSRLGHPGEWTCEDVEAARLQANETARPGGLHGPTPVEAWRQHRRISAKERMVFAKIVNRHEQEALAGQHDSGQLATIRRAAIGHALAAGGLLEYRRERQVAPSGKCPEGSAGKPVDR